MRSRSCVSVEWWLDGMTLLCYRSNNNNIFCYDYCYYYYHCCDYDEADNYYNFYYTVVKSWTDNDERLEWHKLTLFNCRSERWTHHCLLAFCVDILLPPGYLPFLGEGGANLFSLQTCRPSRLQFWLGINTILRATKKVLICISVILTVVFNSVSYCNV